MHPRRRPRRFISRLSSSGATRTFLLGLTCAVAILATICVVPTSPAGTGTADSAAPVATAHTSLHFSPVPIPPVHVGPLAMASPESIDPKASYSSEPAPMGIADFGIGYDGNPYTYSTTEFLGNFSWQKLNLDSSGGTEFSDQLNVVLQFVRGTTTYAYWIQDVAFMDSSTGAVQFENNIWNFTAPGQCLSSSSVKGNGSVQVYDGCGYYVTGASSQPGAMRTMPSPGNFQLLVRSYLSAGGLPEVAFEYRDGVTNWYVTYDNVVWPWASGLVSDNNFVVDGSEYNPYGLFYDAELVMGGPGGGTSSVAQDLTDARTQLLFWNGFNFQAPISAWNFGGNTAETVSNLQSIWSASAGGAPFTLQLNGTTTDATPGQAYDQEQVGFLKVSAPSLSSGTVAVGNVDWSFVGDEANLTLDPGAYPVWVNSSGGPTFLGECTILAGHTLNVVSTERCAPSTGTPVASPAKADLGQTVTFETTPIDTGSGGDTFSWNVTPSALGCGTSTTTTLVCVPTATGTYRINVTIKDSSGRSATSGNLTFGVVPDPTVAAPSASRAMVETGGTVTFTTSVSGGVSPFTFSWSGLPGPCTGTSGASPTCTPASAATYSISVTADDQNGYASTSSVLSYTVGTGPTPSALSATPSGSVDVGQAVEFVTTVAGGSGALTYEWEGLPTGCSSQNLSKVTCTPSAPGPANVSVVVTDTNGGEGTSGALAYVTDSDPVVIVSSLTRSVDVGQTVVFSAIASGGSGGYEFNWSGLPTGCVSSGSASDSCTPSSSGNFSISVMVTDTNGWNATSEALAYRVYGSPVLAPPTGSVASVDLGQSVTFTTTAHGGSGGYTYNWSGLPTGCASENSSSVYCEPAVAGNFSVVVNVTDSNGAIATSRALLFEAHPDPSVASFDASPGTVLAGSGTTFAVGTVGGSGPFTYNYSGLPSGCASRDLPSLSCTPSGTGTFTVVVTITDANGRQTTATTRFTVNPALFGLPPFEVYLVVGGLCAVVAGGTVAFWTRRRRGRPARRDVR